MVPKRLFMCSALRGAGETAMTQAGEAKFTHKLEPPLIGKKPIPTHLPPPVKLRNQQNNI